MGFIDDVDLVMPFLRRGVHGPLTQLPRILHTPVAGGIDLDDVDIGGPVPHPKAIFALATRLTRGFTTRAVERHGQYPSRCGLAHSPWTGEQIPMADASPGYRATEHGHDVILNQQVSEALGAVSTGESDHEAIVYRLLVIGRSGYGVRSPAEQPIAHSQ
jgi:hypothetical protein